MKRISILIISVIFFAMASSVYAANNEAQGMGNQDSKNQEQQELASPSPIKKAIQNQNQVKTQNEGEESQLRVNTQEQESLNSNSFDSKNENAIANMSEVAIAVQGLLATDNFQGEGLGSQVRQIAQEQNQAQKQIKEDLDKLQIKNGIMKKLFGPDYKTIKNLNQQMEQNRLRIQQLEQLATQIENQADQIQLEEVIQTLIDQNTALEEQVQSEEEIGSIFGWLIKIFSK